MMTWSRLSLCTALACRTASQADLRGELAGRQTVRLGDDREMYWYPAERRRLVQQWAAVDRQLEAIRELPVGETDPAERERQLLEDQDRIEHDMGRLPLDNDANG
jgi:hypothetical protein